MASNQVKSAEAALDELDLDTSSSEPKSQAMPLLSDAQLLKRANLELELLYAIEQQIAAAHDLTEMITRVLEQVCKHLGFEAAALLLVDTVEAHVLAVADGNARDARVLRRASALRWLEHTRSAQARIVEPPPTATHSDAPSAGESQTQPKVRRTGLLLTVQGTHKRKVYEVPQLLRDMAASGKKFFG